MVRKETAQKRERKMGVEETHTTRSSTIGNRVLEERGGSWGKVRAKHTCHMQKSATVLAIGVRHIGWKGRGPDVDSYEMQAGAIDPRPEKYANADFNCPTQLYYILENFLSIYIFPQVIFADSDIFKISKY